MYSAYAVYYQTTLFEYMSLALVDFASTACLLLTKWQVLSQQTDVRVVIITVVKIVTRHLKP